MDILTGILVDVSGSMEVNVDDNKVKEKGGSWAKSIFKFIDRLIKHDANSDNQVFAVAFGSSRKQVTFDVLTTLKRLGVDKADRSKRDMLEEITRILKTSGAPRISELATIDEMSERIDERQTAALLSALKYSSTFRDKFIFELLPASCRLTRNLSKMDMLSKAMDIMENNGAPRVRKWATEKEIDAQIDERTTAVIYAALNDNQEFKRKFINECLPDECRKLDFDNTSACFKGLGILGLYAAFPPLGIVAAAGYGVGVLYGLRKEIANNTIGWNAKVHQRMTEDSIKDAIDKGIKLAKAEGMYISVKDLMDRAVELVKDYILAEVCIHYSVYSARDASEILHGCVGEQELTDDRTNKLYEDVKPFLYGGTPLMESLRHAVRLFRNNRDSQYKLLFILSDGEPADGNSPPVRELADLGVTVSCCYITSRPIDEPRRLYSDKNSEWESPAKFMFDMSSKIATDKIPKTLFVKKGWKIDIDRNETRLFFQINHPDITDEVCDLARDCVCSQDSLADVLSSVSLDIYINKANENLSPDRQREKEKTCYAIASATAIHMALMRIVGREGGYPGFYAIRDELISMYGVKGAKVGEVLKKACPAYRLRCEMVEKSCALRAIVEKHPVVAIFQLSDDEWRSFYKFYQHKPQGILTKCQVDIEKRPQGVELRGHAVVLTSFDSKSLRLMNSKGSDWADGGFFKVRNAAVLDMRFYDVYWTEEDLRPSEKEAYRRDGGTISAMLIDKLVSLQTATYVCPLCSVESNVSEFRGHLLAAVCPRCERSFNANTAQSDLALNIYLTSLLSSDSEAEQDTNDH